MSLHSDSGVKHPRAREFLRVFIVALLVLTTVRLSLAAGIEHYVNRTLGSQKDYAGSIGQVRLNLWRGAYVIEELTLRKRSGDSTEPFIAASSVDLSIRWASLMRGALVGEVTLHHPVLNLVLSQDPSADRTSIDSDWRDTLRNLFPFKIDQVQVRSGRVRFRDLRKQPIVDVELADVQARLQNLTNIGGGARSNNSKEQLSTTLEAMARPLGAGSIWLKLEFDPFATSPTFDLDAAIEQLDLVRLNDFLRAYANLDVERGTFKAFLEVAASEGRVTGYIKPFFEDLDIVDQREIKGVSDLPHAAYEAAAGVAAKALENPDTNQVATKIPIEGRIDATRTSLWSTIGELLRNAFIRALNPSLEGSITIGEAEKKQTEQEKKTRAADARAAAKTEESDR